LRDPGPAVSWAMAGGAAKPTKRIISDIAESIRIPAVDSAPFSALLGHSTFVILTVMHSRVACSAQRDQVLLGVFPRMTAEFLVVHLKIRHRATGLTSPAVAMQDLLVQTFIRQGVQPQANGFGANHSQDAFSRRDGEESSEEFHALVEQLWEEYEPIGVVEESLVERIAACWWRTARVLRAENGEIRERLDTLAIDREQQNSYKSNRDLVSLQFFFSSPQPRTRRGW